MPTLKYNAPEVGKKQTALLHYALFGGLVRTYPHNGRKVPVVQRGGKYYYEYLGVPGVKRTGRALAEVSAQSTKKVEQILKQLGIRYEWR